MRYFYLSLFLLLFRTLANSQDNCLVNAYLTADPLPDPSTLQYAPGTSVEFCYVITAWEVTVTLEWLHALQLEFGSGWYEFTVDPIPPPSCNGIGYWDWYEFWVSTNTGIGFGPGFAYDSPQGGPLDGDPGNNWGDGGNGCEAVGIGSPPVAFCWTIEASNLSDQSIQISALSDGLSGSYNSSSCSGEVSYSFLPDIYYVENVLSTRNTTYTCDSLCDGDFTITTRADTWHHQLFDTNGNLVWEDTLPAGVDTLFLCPNSYILNSVSTTNGMEFTKNFTIGSRPTPTATADYANPVCANISPQLLGSATNVGGTPVSYYWEGPDNYYSYMQNPVNGPGPGMYTLTTSVGVCRSTPDTIIVPQLPTPPLDISPGTDITICPGESIQLSAVGAIYNEWFIGDSSIHIGPALNVSPSETTVYTVRGPVSDNPCDAHAEIIVYVDDFSTFDLGPDQNICQGEEIIIGSSDTTVQYLWNTGQTTSPLTLAPDTATNYSLTVTATGGCSAAFDILITPVTNPNSGIEAAASLLCKGDSTILIANYDGGAPPYTFVWSTGATTDTITVIPEITTNYSLTVTDSNGCSDAASINIEVIPDETTIVAVDSILCPGQTTTLTVYEFVTFYSWSHGQISQSIEIAPTSTEIYWVTITDFNGCNKTDSIIIEVVPPPNPPIINCTSTTSSITFSWEALSGFSYNAFSLSGPAGIQTDSTYVVTGLSPNEEVTLQLVAFSAEGCEAISEQTCSAIDCPTVELVTDTGLEVCADASPFLLELMTTGGAGGGTTTWSGPCISDPSTGEFDPQLCGPGVHQVVATYTEGPCSYQVGFAITVLPVYSADLTMIEEACLMDTVTVVYSGDAPDTAIFNWNFDDANVLSGSGAGPYTLQWDNPGDHQIELSVGDNCPGESVGQTITIGAPLDAPLVSCSLDVPNGVITFNWNAITGATAYQLSLNGEDLPDITETEIAFDSFAPEETVTLIVTPLNDGVCTNPSGEASCTLPPCPSLIVTPTDMTICAGESVPLTANFGDDASYSWTPATGLSCTDCPNPVATPDISTSYTVTANNSDGCTASAAVNLMVTPQATILLEPSYDVCLGETVELCLQNVTMVVWTGPKGYYYENNCLIVPDFAEENSGTYYLHATFLDGCTIEDSIDLNLLPPLEVMQIPQLLEACPNQVFTLSAEVANAEYYHWFPIQNVFCPNCPTTLASITHPTIFTLVVLDQAGCELQIEVPVTIPVGCAEEPDIDDPIFLGNPGNDGPIEMMVFPNPTRDKVTVQWNQEVEGKLELFDIQGQLLEQLPVYGQKMMVDLAKRPSGIYWLRLASKGGVVSRKVLKE